MDDPREALGHARRGRRAVSTSHPRLAGPLAHPVGGHPHSMIVIGSVIASGIAPSAGGGVHSPSRSSFRLRPATIGGQCFGPSARPRSPR